LVILRPGAGTLGLGHLAAVVSTLFYALSVIVLRRIGPAEPGGGLLLAQMAGLLLATAPTLPFVYTAPEGRDLGLMALAGAFNGFAQIGLLKAYRSAPPAVVAPFQYTQMLWAVVFGYLLFAELPSRWTILGSLIIIGSG